MLIVSQDKMKTTEKMEYKKYCPNCKSVQIFTETKIGK